MRLPEGLRAFRHRDFRIFFGAQAVSQIGTWMHSVAQAWLVLSLTDSPLLLGLLATVQWGPMLLLAIPSGAIADRLPKRRLLMVTQASQACTVMTLVALVGSGLVAYWHLAVLAVCAGLASTLDNPARQSFVIDMVGRDDVVNAVALNSAAFNGARIVGPALGGLVIARFGVLPAFVVNAAAYLVVVGALAMLAAEGRPRRRPPATIREEIAEGLAYALRTPDIRAVLLVLLVTSFCVFNFSIYVPLLARNVLGQGAQGFGFLMAAVGIGAVSGAITLGTVVPRRPPLALLYAGSIVACAGLLALAGVREFWLAAAGLFVVGYAGVVTVAGCNTSLQLSSSDDLRGRVMSLYTLIFGGSFPIAAFILGAISERWSVSTAFFAGGATGLLSLAALLTARRLGLRVS